MNLAKLFLYCILFNNYAAFAHSTHSNIEEVKLMLIEGSLDYKKSSNKPIVFEKIEEKIITQQNKALLNSFSVNLKASSESIFSGFSANINLAFLDANHLVLSSNLLFQDHFSNENKNNTQYLSKQTGDHFRIFNYLCINGRDESLDSQLNRRRYVCIVVQSQQAHGYYKDQTKLESYLNALKIKSIAPDLVKSP